MYRIYVIGPRVIKSRDIEFVGYVTRLRVDFDVDLILYKAVTYIHVVRVVESGFVVIEVNHGIASEAPMAPGQFRVRQGAGSRIVKEIPLTISYGSSKVKVNSGLKPSQLHSS